MTQMSLVLVNQALARQYAPNGNILNHVLTSSGRSSDPSQSLTPQGNHGAFVVGLVPDTMMRSSIHERDDSACFAPRAGKRALRKGATRESQSMSNQKLISRERPAPMEMRRAISRA